MRRSPAAVVLAVAAVLASTVPASTAVANPTPVSHDEQITYHRWQTFPQWRGGTSEGTRAVPGRKPFLTIDQAAGTTQFTDPHSGTATTWEYATWTSPVQQVGFGASELVASWLRTKRYRANGSVGSGSGGIVYLIAPSRQHWPRAPGSDNW